MSPLRRCFGLCVLMLAVMPLPAWAGDEAQQDLE